MNSLTQKGYSLLELMVSITIGSFLILGAAYAFEEARRTYSTNDNVANLYEQAQYVTSLLDEDIRLANFWGLHNRASAVRGDTRDPIPGAAVIPIDNDCLDTGWALNVDAGTQGSDDMQNPAWAVKCAVNILTNTDTLVIRRSGSEPVDATFDGAVYVVSDETPSSIIFEGDDTVGIPTAPTAANLTYDFIAHGYYVENGTANGLPTLMRETLIDGGSQPIVETQEIMRGVEDFQIQFGIDYDRPSHANPNYGVVDRYVDPDSPYLALPYTRILSVRYWVLLQSDREELGYVNENSYKYANLAIPYKPGDGFRRLLVSKTIKIRNLTNDQ